MTSWKRNFFGKDGSPVRRLAITADSLVTQPFKGIDIIPTAWYENAVGWRDIVLFTRKEGKVTEKKTCKYFQLSDYKYLISALARGLIHHQITKDDIFNIYAQTSINWQLMSHACMTIGTPPNCVGVFTNADLLATLKNVLLNTPSIKFIVYDGDAKPSLINYIHNIRGDIVILSIDELHEIGAEQSTKGLEERRPSKDDVAMIMYTGGTTGAPKGVVLTHGNVIASLAAVYTLLGHHVCFDDTFLAYLPLAHIFEYIVELTLFFVGITTGYGRVKTLTDVSVRRCKGDIVTFRPSIMVGVPAVWEQIRKWITGRINASSSLKKTIFTGAMAAMKASVPGLSQVANAVVRLRLTLSAGGALSKETQEFLSIALATMLQGYGTTESCGMCAILPPELMQYGSVGLPVPSAEIKLLDSTNNPPQGEVCIRGPSVTPGYYKRDDLNNDESIFTRDGWLRTGDIGQWNADGTLSLIDR
ncbi:AMP-dependent synthetase/ligase [Suillus spraguei]|nr:AMP-dependent synthetase/ligase [Suillus spraguei]